MLVEVFTLPAGVGNPDEIPFSSFEGFDGLDDQETIGMTLRAPKALAVRTVGAAWNEAVGDGLH